MGAARIVSLVPSLTELICDLGLREQLVGRTGFCVHPKAALREVPKVGGTKTVDIERVRSLRPTHLIVNVDENEKPTVDALRQFVPQVVVTHPIEVADNLELYQRLGRMFGAGERAAQLQAQLQEQMRLCAQRDDRPRRVLYLIWRDPWMTVAADTYIARMLASVGLHVLTVPGRSERYPSFEWSMIGLNPQDAILLSSEPYRFTERHAEDLHSRQAGAQPVMLVDGEMTSWYGSRAILGLNYLRGFRERLDLLGRQQGVTQ